MVWYKRKALECEELFHSLGYYWESSSDDSSDDNSKWIVRDGHYSSQTFAFIDFKRKKFDGYTSKKPDDLKLLTYPENIYKITSLLKTGREIPTYKPKGKRILERSSLLEGVENEKINKVYIHLTDGEISKKIQLELFSMGFTWGSGSVVPKFLDEDDTILNIYLDEMKLFRSVGLDFFIEFKKPLVPKVYHMYEWDVVKNIIKTGKEIPTYKPRSKRNI